MKDDCIFCKIGSGQIRVHPVFENEEFIAFRDSNPQAPVHVLLIPRSHYETLMDVTDAGLLSRILPGAPDDGYCPKPPVRRFSHGNKHAR